MNPAFKQLAILLFIALTLACNAGDACALVSNNLDLGGPAYLYLEKLEGMGLVDGYQSGLRPITKEYAAALVKEAEANLQKLPEEDSAFAAGIIARLRELVPREYFLQGREDGAKAFSVDPLDSFRLRFVALDGRARSYDRLYPDFGRDGPFGIGHERPFYGKDNFLTMKGGREGTPLMENGEGVAYAGNSVEMRADAEVFVKTFASALVEPLVLSTADGRDAGSEVTATLHKAYVKAGLGDFELEAGRDSVWFGQGFRGATVLSNNAAPLYMVKLASPLPLGPEFIRKYLGQVKYAVLAARLSGSGEGSDYRRPYLFAFKLSVKPTASFEAGINYARQIGGPGSDGFGTFFNGGNTVSGLDLKLRLQRLWGATLYFEYMGEDNYGIIPFVESYLFGVYFPRLTKDGRDDLRLECYIGNKIAYVNGEFPEGFTEKGLVLGDSQGGDAKDLLARFTHHFGPRHRVSLDYIYTQRGRLGRNHGEAIEGKNAGRLTWDVPVKGDFGLSLMYGLEMIKNFDLVRGDDRTNQVFRVDLTYRY